MLSIGITVCDKDYKLCDNLLSQIKKKVKCKYEIIIIDNREEFKNEKTSWTPTFKFGYNAYQFASRAKIVKLSKGDYIWFIDGDDDIGEVKHCNYDEDIIVFSYNTYPNGSFYYDNELKDKDTINYYNIKNIGPTLWNKFIKKELFSKEFINAFGDKKIVLCEDTIWLHEAVTHAKSLRTVKDLIYYHKEGLSNKLTTMTIKELQSLIVGFNDAKKIVMDFFKEGKSIYLERTYYYLGGLIPQTEDVIKATKIIMDLIPKENFKDVLQKSVYPKCRTQEQLKTIINVVKEQYGEEYPFKEIIAKVTREDGTIEDYKVVQYIEFEGDDSKYLHGRWNHNLSIVCLVYEGNIQYLKKFISMLKNVEIEHEVIIVDNRENKTEELDYEGEAVIVKAEGNVGILNGRRLGFEASKNDYVWFVDIDDYVLPVQDMDYGNNDVLCFSFYSPKDRINIGKRIIPDTDFFTTEIIWKINVVLWNKWFKRSVLERAYRDIPHFLCVYAEDTVVTYTALKYAKYIEFFECEPIYSHIINENSITTKIIKDKESVDLLFVGCEDAINYFEKNFKLSKELVCNSIYVIIFYLDIMNRADDCILQYFADKLISLYGLDNILKTIKLAKDKFEPLHYNRIKNYFKENSIEK